MTQHTKEPWAVSPDNRDGMEWNNHIVSLESPHLRICFMAHDGTDENVIGEANARRIVACVNACAPVSTEFLENTPDLATAFMSAENARLMQVNAALLSALNDLVYIVENYAKNKDDMTARLQALLPKCIEAIGKAEAA